MKKYSFMISIPIGVMSFILSAPVVLASVTNSVNISNNGSGSTSRVEVNNNINTSNSNTTTTNNTSTHIRIDTNGQVKEYDSNQPGDITVYSNDGTSTVHVNNNSSPNTHSIITPITPSLHTASSTPKLTPRPTPPAHIFKSPFFQLGDKLMSIFHNIFSLKWL